MSLATAAPAAPAETALEKARQIAAQIKSLADRYVNVVYSGRRIKTLEAKIENPDDIREMMLSFAQYLEELAKLASGRTKKSLDQKAEAFRKYAAVAAEAARKILSGVKVEELSDDEKKALLMYALTVRALATLKRSYSEERVLNNLNAILSAPNRALAAAFRAELQTPSQQQSAYASKPEMWLKYPRRFDLQGIDDKARSMVAEAVRYELGMRSRASAYAPSPEEVLSKTGEIDDVRKHFDVVIHLEKYMDKLSPEARNYLLSQLARNRELVAAILNPDMLWGALKSLKDGRPLAEHFTAVAEATGRRGLMSPRFIAYNYAWRLLMSFYLPGSIASRVGIDIPGVRRESYNAIRRLLSAKLAEKLKEAGVEGKWWKDLTEEEKRRVARAVVESVLETLEYLGFRREDVLKAAETIAGAGAATAAA